MGSVDAEVSKVKTEVCTEVAVVQTYAVFNDGVSSTSPVYKIELHSPVVVDVTVTVKGQEAI